MTERINELLSRKMDRKEFLRHVGYGTAMLFGLGTVLKLVSSPSRPSNLQAGATSAKPGYGNGAYGG
ncbi:MAG TPA: hypothetical protein VNG90_00210 [Candidatus Acidoferrum sp.]|nr:hypothetical protein [Candidatus Acidoferrum sp.]